MNLFSENLSELSSVAMRRYNLFTDSLLGLLDATLSAPGANTPSVRSKFSHEASVVGWNFIEDEMRDFRSNIDALAEQAVKDASDSTTLSYEDRESIFSQVSESISSYRVALGQQMNRDIRVITSYLMKLAINVQMLQSQRNIGEAMALMTVRSNDVARKALSMTFVDTAGRRWDSHRYVKTLTRQTYLSIYNETIIHAASFGGVNIGYVAELSEQVYFRFIEDGMNGEFKLYDEIKSKYFHPKSSYRVGLISH